ncbi:hypothetical protein [Zobellia laminariae]|uniref:hypothetical protein n=1 Tax=Zobellia laminariae TaxID=248906 RepID=UPI0026F445C0|nr:hypothetical protein [Zobellia laminariae]WKX74954.1 hypothetical protein Q5W13_14415 [Zobellia laminariae]
MFYHLGLELISSSISKGTFTYPNWNVGGMTSGDLETLTLVTRASLDNIYSTTANYINTVTNSQDQIDSNITTDDPSETVTVNKSIPTTVITNRKITYRVNRN